jgi:hypothetical protein
MQLVECRSSTRHAQLDQVALVVLVSGITALAMSSPLLRNQYPDLTASHCRNQTPKALEAIALIPVNLASGSLSSHQKQG